MQNQYIYNRNEWCLSESFKLWTYLHTYLWALSTYLLPTSFPSEHPHPCSVVTLHIKIGWRKVNICRYGSRKWFFSCIFAQFAEASKKRSKAVHPLEKSVINMTWLLILVFDWPIIMIGPVGLLLVVPTYLQSFVWVLWVGLQKSK